MSAARSAREPNIREHAYEHKRWSYSLEVCCELESDVRAEATRTIEFGDLEADFNSSGHGARQIQLKESVTE